MATEVIRAWIAAAEDDLRAVRDCLHGPEPTPTVAAYHCQQAAEKLLKAVLVSKGIHPPRSHDIGHLLDLVGATHPTHPALSPLARFTPYAWLYRYPAADPTEITRQVPRIADVVAWLDELRHALETVKSKAVPST